MSVFKIITLVILVCGFACSITQVVADTDPTRPFGYRAASSVTPKGKKLVLESIIYGDGIHTVVISGKVLKTFDHIGEYQLTAVNEQSVILRSKTERLKLTIFKSNVVKIKFTSEKVLAKNS
ncbi:MAG: hypothetical protein JKX67_12355 [Colwellia sp.]|nr:hypothetical protein [Colwellia sp.]